MKVSRYLRPYLVNTRAAELWRTIAATLRWRNAGTFAKRLAVGEETYS